MPQKPLEKLEQFAIDVILERRYGKRAALLRWFLLGLSLIYGQIIRLRSWVYLNRLIKWHHVGCRVISIGNLTVGGTGKTPVVEQFARCLTQAGRKVAILSRGYKSTPLPFWQRIWYRLTFRRSSLPPRIVSNGKSVLLDPTTAGDEPFMLASNLDRVYVLVDKNRIKSAVHAIEEYGVDTILLDDGYQYLPFRERLNVALIDREAPFGNEFLLPRGTLREPHSHLRRADVIFITKCDGSDLSRLKARIRRFNRHAEIIECTHHPLYLKEINTGRQLPLSYLQGRKVGAVAGIAVPESFCPGSRTARSGGDLPAFLCRSSLLFSTGDHQCHRADPRPRRPRPHYHGKRRGPLPEN
jgi:tetraacyldisaccharide 4'-kinase